MTRNDNNNNNNFIECLINRTLGDKASTTYQSNNVLIQPAVTADMIPYTFNTLESSTNWKIARSNIVISPPPHNLHPSSSSSSPAPTSSYSSSMDSLKTNDNNIAVQKPSTDNANEFVNSTIELKEDKKVSKIVEFGENQIPHDQSDVLNSVDSSTSLYDKKPEVLVERNTTKKYEEDNGKDYLIFRNVEILNKEKVSEQKKELSETNKAISSDAQQYYHQGISKNNIATSSSNNSSSSSTNINNQTIGKKGISPQNSQKNNNNDDVAIAYTTAFTLNRTKTADDIHSTQIKNAATTNMLNGNANDRTNATTSLPIFSDTQQQTEEKKFSNSDAIKPESSFIQPPPNYPSHSQILTNEKNQYIKDNKNEASITINIGRIDIRAIQQQQKLNSKVRRDTPESYYLTLRDYLKQRSTRSVAGL